MMDSNKDTISNQEAKELLKELYFSEEYELVPKLAEALEKAMESLDDADFLRGLMRKAYEDGDSINEEIDDVACTKCRHRDENGNCPVIEVGDTCLQTKDEAFNMFLETKRGNINNEAMADIVRCSECVHGHTF